MYSDRIQQGCNEVAVRGEYEATKYINLSQEYSLGAQQRSEKEEDDNSVTDARERHSLACDCCHLTERILVSISCPNLDEGPCSNGRALSPAFISSLVLPTSLD